MARFCVVVTLAVCCLITGSSGFETWLSRACTDNSHCPAGRNSTCFNLQCACIPGYYYSSSQGMCIKECPNIKPLGGFVEYSHTSINVSSIDTAYKDSRMDCWLFCLMEPECRAVVYHIYYAECTILNVTAQGLSSDRWFQNRDTVTYVKKCA